MNQIDIHYYTQSNGEKKIIPVLYDVEDLEEQFTQILHCRIALPQHEMPSWLYPEKFDLITDIQKNMQLMDDTLNHDAELRTLDADFFRYKVHSEIVFHEQQRLANGFPEC